MKKTRFVIMMAAALPLVFSTGCMTQISKSEISPKGYGEIKTHPGTIQIAVTGGDKINTDFFTTETHTVFNIENQTIQDAIADGISQSGLFSQVMSSGNADYQLDVLLLLIKQPGQRTGGGLLLTAPQANLIEIGNTRMLWKLTRLSDHKQIFQDEIVSEDRETPFTHFVGSTRERSAVTGAMQKNIQQGIEQLGKLDF